MERKILIDEETINKRVHELADEISKDYEGKEILLLAILKGSVYFFTDLTRRIKGNTLLSFVRLSSYSGEESTGNINIKIPVTDDIKDKDIVVVEDIVDSGRTLSYFLDYLKENGARSVKLCALLNKPSRRVVEDLEIDYLGFTIKDRFVVGYGLDLDEAYRTIPRIECFTDDNDEILEKERKEIINQLQKKD